MPSCNHFCHRIGHFVFTPTTVRFSNVRENVIGMRLISTFHSIRMLCAYGLGCVTGLQTFGELESTNRICVIHHNLNHFDVAFPTKTVFKAPMTLDEFITLLVRD
jgi:hypothetical protein